MQQTEKYQFNLIETSDTFSPDPLNENMEKAEQALSAEAAALDSRVTVLEAHKIVAGYHAGTGFVDLGFTPAAVFGRGDSGFCFAIEGHPAAGLSLAKGGFNHTGYYSNCYYLAIL